MTLPPLIFGSKGDGVHVDLERLYESRLLIQGVSGSGKSTMARSLLEQTHGKIPQLVVDFDGDFVTLREKFDYVLFGPGGDFPISIKTAKITMRRLVELDASAIFDISEMKFDDRRTWVRLACEELVHLPRKHWSTRLFVLDEAHIFCPERGGGDAESAAAVIDVITLGRKRGIVSVCLTQRLSKFHKDAAAELLNKVIGYTDDVDLVRAGDQLGMLKEQRDELRNLEPHTFYVKGPAISRPPLLTRTLPPATKPPPRGQARPDAPPAPAAVRKVLAQLIDLPKEAEEEARSIADLQRKTAEQASRIRQLEKGVATKTVEKPVVDQAAIDRAVARAVTGAKKEFDTSAGKLRRALEAAMKFIINVSTQNFDIAGVDKAELERAIGAAVAKATGMVEQRLASRQKNIEQLRDSAKRIVSALKSALDDDTPVEISVAVQKNEPFTVSSPAKPRREPQAPRVSDGRVSPSQQRILNALASLEALGISPAKRINVAFFAGYTENGHFNNMVGELRTNGLLDYPGGGSVQLTDEGRAVADAGANSIQTLADLHNTWLSKLSPSEGKLLRVLIDRGVGNPITRPDLAAETGYTENGHFNNMVGHLRTLGAADYPGGGQVVVTDVLFPEGLT